MTEVDPLKIPCGHEDDEIIISVSGGKDSTAALLRYRESGISFRAAFADTGWEAQETYDHLAALEARLGITIHRVGVPGGFPAQALREGILPHGKTAWCTRELKVKPLREFHERVARETDRDTISVVGIRNDESRARAQITREFEYDDRWGGYVWRPLLRWTVEDVLAIHHRHGVPVNPLYKMGFSRVGCAPCRNARKDEIRLWAELFPARIDAVRELEREVAAERQRRGHKGAATFFTTDAEGPIGIDTAVAWSRTSRGGVQLRLVQDNPDGGCFRWGMCEPPATGQKADDAEDA